MKAKEFLEDYNIRDFDVFGRNEEHYSLDDLMEEYAKIYHESEVKKLNIPAVIKSVCECKVCGERFDNNENVIWDSGFGYEVGYFLGEGVSYNTFLIDIRTGLIAEPCSHPKNEIYKYTDDLIDKLTKKYGYEKRFSKTF